MFVSVNSNKPNNDKVNRTTTTTMKGKRAQSTALLTPSSTLTRAKVVISNTSSTSLASETTKTTTTAKRAASTIASRSLTCSSRLSPARQSNTTHDKRLSSRSLSRQASPSSTNLTVSSKNTPFITTNNVKTTHDISEKPINLELSRTAKYRINFTGGTAINGMAIDLPSHVYTSLRRTPATNSQQS
uniref:Uncharacterized protein n=1 Tax=Lygus hesperus TaxID=30085 RepID=A0A146L9E8_LYGHE